MIDFESTCWKDKKGAQEISESLLTTELMVDAISVCACMLLPMAVEFPAVLLDIHTGDVVDEFQQYVQPQHNPILSDFCKELTGISQVQ